MKIKNPKSNVCSIRSYTSDEINNIAYEMSTTNLHERINFKSLGKNRRDITSFKFSEWSSACNGVITKPLPEADFLAMLEQNYDDRYVDTAFLKMHGYAGKGIQSFKDAIPSVEPNLSNKEQLEELLRLNAEQDLLRRLPEDKVHSMSNLKFTSSLLSLANFYTSSRVDEKMSITPIAYNLLDCTGFNSFRFDTLGESYISLSLSEEQGASCRVDFTTSLKLNEEDGVKMPSQPNLPFIISSGIENKVWKLKPNWSAYMAQIAMQSYLIASRNYAGYNVNVPIPMTLIVGSFCKQFLFIYGDDVMKSAVKGGEMKPEHARGYCVPIGHNSYHKEDGLSLLAKGERNDALWGMHKISKYLAQPLKRQLTSEQAIQKLFSGSDALLVDEVSQKQLRKLE